MGQQGKIKKKSNNNGATRPGLFLILSYFRVVCAIRHDLVLNSEHNISFTMYNSYFVIVITLLSTPLSDIYE